MTLKTSISILSDINGLKFSKLMQLKQKIIQAEPAADD